MRSGLVISGILIGGAGFFVPAPFNPYVIGLGLILLLAGIFVKPKQEFA